MNLGDRYFMPCWKWERLDESVARMYASRHSRLAIPGQLDFWDSDRRKLTNINRPSTTNTDYRSRS